LLKAKYCPRAAAVSRTQKNTENPCDLDLEIQQGSICCQGTSACKNFIKLSAAVYELSTVN